MQQLAGVHQLLSAADQYVFNHNTAASVCVSVREVRGRGKGLKINVLFICIQIPQFLHKRVGEFYITPLFEWWPGVGVSKLQIHLLRKYSPS